MISIQLIPIEISIIYNGAKIVKNPINKAFPPYFYPTSTPFFCLSFAGNPITKEAGGENLRFLPPKDAKVTEPHLSGSALSDGCGGSEM